MLTYSILCIFGRAIDSKRGENAQIWYMMPTAVRTPSLAYTTIGNRSLVVLTRFICRAWREKDGKGVFEGAQVSARGEPILMLFAGLMTSA